MNETACIGLIGGMGPPSTVAYYEALVKSHAERDVALRLMMAHADFDHAAGFLAASDMQGLAEYLASLAGSLAAAGSDFVAIAAITPHICARELSDLSPLPVLDILDVLADTLRARGMKRIALLGARYTMRAKAFGRLDAFDVVDLSEGTIDEIDRIYRSIVAAGTASNKDVAFIRDLALSLHRDEHADAVVVAGTELSLILGEDEEAFPVVDCARAHVRAIADRALAR